ncbi:MAG: kelch repeat-containing protein [Burkholderiaceae bacterium]
MNDGKVLMAGTNMPISTTSDLFDPATNAYAQAPTETGPIFGTGQITRLASGKLLITGGLNVGEGMITSNTYLYDPATNAFTNGPPLPTPLYHHTATLLADGRVILTGGATGSGVATATYFYDPVAGTFTAGPPMSTARYWHAARRLQDGRVMLFGGNSGVGVLASTEIYDPATNSFTPSASMAHAGSGSAIEVLADGRILVAGGYTSTAVATAQIFDPQTGQFTSTGSLNAPATAGPPFCCRTAGCSWPVVLMVTKTPQAPSSMTPRPASSR